MARRRISILGIVIASINLVVAVFPPGAGCIGASYFFKDPAPMPIQNSDIGPELRREIDKAAPSAKAEAIGSTVCSSFLSLVLIAGCVGLFMNHQWGRWVTVGAAVLMILTFCIHDIYQFGIVRPATA